MLEIIIFSHTILELIKLKFHALFSDFSNFSTVAKLLQIFQMS